MILEISNDKNSLTKCPNTSPIFLVAQPSQWWGGLVAGVMQVDSCAELDLGARHGTAQQLVAGWAGAAVTAWQLAVVWPVSSCSVLHPARGGRGEQGGINRGTARLPHSVTRPGFPSSAAATRLLAARYIFDTEICAMYLGLRERFPVRLGILTYLRI